MDLIKPEALAEPVPKRILVSMAPGVMKQGYSIARLLREAGFIAEFALDGQETATCDWLLEVRSKSPVFALTDQVSGRKSLVNSTAGVLALLGCEGDVTEDSFA